MSTSKTLFAALTLSAAAALAPTAGADTYDYLDCKRADKDAQAVGAVLGGLIGAVAGHEIAGRGETTEGAVIGGLLGAAAGAGVGDDRRNCRRESAVRGSVGHSTGYTVPATTTYGNGAYGNGTYGNGTYGNARVIDANHHGHRGHRRDRNRGYNRGYDFDNGGWRNPRDVRYRIEQLKDEDRQLKRRARYEYRPWIDRRRDEIRWEVKRLKRIEDRLKDRRDYRREARRDRRNDRRDYRRDYQQDYRHYHGSNVCYSRH